MKKKTITLAVLTDLHYGPATTHQVRRCELALLLTRQAVEQLNRTIHPDITLILGDVLNKGTASSATERRKEIRSILDQLQSPWLIIPGNHDGDVNAFYQAFPRPHAIEDIVGIRFLPFLDCEESGFNASRTPEDIERFYHARMDHNGPIIALQHVCLTPPDRQPSPYNYTNAATIIKAMTASDILLSISGHHHNGAPDIRHHNTTFITAPGLCEAPFPFLCITIDRGRITSRRYAIATNNIPAFTDTFTRL